MEAVARDLQQSSLPTPPPLCWDEQPRICLLPTPSSRSLALRSPRATHAWPWYQSSANSRSKASRWCNPHLGGQRDRARASYDLPGLRSLRGLSKQSESEYGARRAAYDLKKLRGKKIVRRIEQTQRYESMPKGLRAMAALVVLRNKAIKPLLAAAQDLRPSRGAQRPRALDTHYDSIRTAMRGVFQELGMAA